MLFILMLNESARVLSWKNSFELEEEEILRDVKMLNEEGY